MAGKAHGAKGETNNMDVFGIFHLVWLERVLHVWTTAELSYTCIFEWQI